MLLLINIFSINKGRWYENRILEIILIECCSTGGFPLEEACEHCFLNQSFISIAIAYIIFVLHILYIWYLASGIRALSLAEIVGIFFLG